MSKHIACSDTSVAIREGSRPTCRRRRTAAGCGPPGSDTVGTITGYSWDFGHKSSGTGVNPTHVFTSGGTYTVVLTVTNNAGQTATTSHVVTVDTQAPAVPAISSPADGSSQSSHSVVLSGTAEANSTIVVYDGSRSVGGASTNSAGNWTSTLTSVADGAHAYTATATDAAGNTSVPSGAVHVTVDTQAPAAPAISSPADGSSQSSHSVVLSGTAEANSTVSVLDGSSVLASAAANGSGTWSTPISGVGDGAHTYTATATDAAGNTSVASSAVHVTVDDVPPVTSITSGTTSTGDADFSFASSEAGSTFECRLTGPNQPEAFTRCSSPIAYHNLATGSYTFSVRATDRAGNIDATPPTWSFTVQPPRADGGASTAGGTAAGSGTGAPVPPTSPSADSPAPTFLPINPPPPVAPAPVKCRVPSLTGLTPAQAKTALSRAHCRLGIVTRQRARRARAGRVLSQSRRAGLAVQSGTRVNVVIARSR